MLCLARGRLAGNSSPPGPRYPCNPDGSLGREQVDELDEAGGRVGDTGRLLGLLLLRLLAKTLLLPRGLCFPIRVNVQSAVLRLVGHTGLQAVGQGRHGSRHDPLNHGFTGPAGPGTDPVV